MKRSRLWSLISASVLAIATIGAYPGPVAAAENAACSAISSAPVRHRGVLVGQSTALDGVKSTIEIQGLARCSGTDPDSPDKNGVFNYVEVTLLQFGADSPLFYDGVGGGWSPRGAAYIRIGQYLCLWTSDSSCGQGHGWFASWGTLAENTACTTTDSVGVRRLEGSTPYGTTVPAYSSGNHTFEISKSGSTWFGYIDGVKVMNFSSPPSYSGEDPSCWLTGSFSFTSTAKGGTWDNGDQLAGTPANKTRFDSVASRLSGSWNTTPLNAVGDASCTGTVSPVVYKCDVIDSNTVDLWTDR